MAPSNTIFFGFMALYVLQWACDLWIDRLNVRHVRTNGGLIPASFVGIIDKEKLARMTAYSGANHRLTAVAGSTSQFLLFILLFSGFLGAVAHYLSSLGLPPLVEALCFFAVPGAILFLAGLPFDHYDTFVLEERFGFNRSTLEIWVQDHIKSLAITIVLFSLLLAIVLELMGRFPKTWWMWAFLAISAIQLLLVFLYPTVIAPLFNKFEPVRDDDLRRRILHLMESNGIRVKQVLQMNAGLRSRHTNAYFTGFWKTKQIVLYDTLLETHTHDEILAVLAHELGHYRERHVLKQISVSELSLLTGLYLSFRLFQWEPFLEAFGFTVKQPYAGLFLLGILWQKVGFFFQPLPMALSRHFERQADHWAVRLTGTGHFMVEALKRLAVDNLANLFPHPWYVAFHHSHPPILQRIEHLERFEP